MKKIFILLGLTASITIMAQRPGNPTPANPGSGGTPSTNPAGFNGQQRSATPKSFKDVITDKAITTKGLFIVHRVDEKYYFEIPDSILGREILAVTRYSKVPGGGGIYGGEIANQQTLRFEKGPNNAIFLRVVTLISVVDSTNVISKAVSNSYVNPIVAAFSIAAYGKDSTSTLIDITDFFKGDNQPVSISANKRRTLNINALATDRSYIQSIHTYPINTEIKTVKTYSASAGAAAPGPFSTATLPAAAETGVITLEMNTSLLLLPKIPMKRRFFDPRVGFFADEYTLYSDDQQKVENQRFAVRYRLEPKPEDMGKYLSGELIEPQKQIIYYIDPATPKQWRPYLIAGVNDWQKAFEKAGFKNAIIAKEWPENDSTMSLEDARFSVIRYFASDIENAYGPNVHDPRSGEILESHVGWYHNVMQLVHDWYMIQTSAVDPKARKMKFDDELMGSLIRFVSSHEIGHTLGLRHNMGSSSKTPVEKLRDKAWVEANGHTASIMDYARFNYVAQPEDNIDEAGLFPRIGDYDKWAIKWGYTYIDAKDEEADKKINNKWITDSLSKNSRLWFGGEGGNADPRAQTEDIGDNAMKASEYGIKNLKRILIKLPEWTREETDKYENLSEMYSQLVAQFSRYMGHVVKNVGGVQETFKSIEEKGDVYEATPKVTQKEAVFFLNKQLFQTPTWLLDKDILNKFSNPAGTDLVSSTQVSVLNGLLSGQRINRLVNNTNRFGSTTYTADEMLEDLRSGVWSELTSKKPIDNYRRILQKAYVEALVNILNPITPATTIVITPSRGSNLGGPPSLVNTDVFSIVRAHLISLRNMINTSLPGITDKMSRYHLQDVSERIKDGLDPKNNR